MTGHSGAGGVNVAKKDGPGLPPPATYVLQPPSHRPRSPIKRPQRFRSMLPFLLYAQIGLLCVFGSKWARHYAGFFFFSKEPRNESKARNDI